MKFRVVSFVLGLLVTLLTPFLDNAPSAAQLLGETLGSASSQIPSSRESVEGVRREEGKGRTVPVLDAYGKLPLHFQRNVGQTDPVAKFLVRDPRYSFFLTPAEAVFVLRRSVTSRNLPSSPESDSTPGRVRPDLTKAGQQFETAVLKMKFIGADPATPIAGLDELPGKVNYFVGADPALWHSNVPTYARVVYRQIYPGIDLVFYGNQEHLEYDLVVAAGADPGVIALQFTGAETVTVDAEGELVLKIAGDEIRWRKPVIYQDVGGIRQPVAGGWVLQEPNRVGFRVAAYDVSRSLVIDPVLAYSTYLGGSNWDDGNAIAVDGTGAAYLTGDIGSVDFPTVNPIQPGSGGLSDAFVAKLNPAGSALVYSTYLGGSSNDRTYSIAVDSTGNAYVAGYTESANFPTVNPIQATYGGGTDAFVAKLNAAGSALVYSTYLGGSSGDFAYGIAVDGTGNAYVAGFTESANFPTVNPIQAALSGLRDAFVTKLNAAGSALVYSTYLGGSGEEIANSIALDAAGAAYVTGYTGSANFPTVNPIQATLGGSWDAFVTKLNAAGSALVYSTYLGGSRPEELGGIAVDGTGNAFVAGYTDSPDFPTVNPIQATLSGPRDAFVAKLSTTGSALVYSTYLGGSNAEEAYHIAVDGAGNAYVTGYTASANFPTVNPMQASLRGSWDAFVVKLVQGPGCPPTDTHCLFRSDWANSLGNSDSALRDGGLWDLAEWGGMPGNTDEINVVNTTAPAGFAHSLRIQQQGSTDTGWSRVLKLNFTPPSTDYHVRYYIRNDDDPTGTSFNCFPDLPETVPCSTIQDHVVQPGVLDYGTAPLGWYNDLTYLNKAEVGGGWRPRLVLGANFPPNSTSQKNWQLQASPPSQDLSLLLQYGRWYRYESWVHFTPSRPGDAAGTARIQVHPCIYDDTNILRYQDADFVSDPGWGGWPNATLATYYNNTNPGGGITDFQVTASNLVHIEFGNNGSASAKPTGKYWYYGAVEIRNDTWPGACPP